MEERRIDLHVHTNVSDGTLSPSEVVELAAKRGLSAIAITDHDAVAGFSEAHNVSQLHGVEVIPGIEFSTKYHKMVHILGYCIDVNNAELLETLDNIVKDRDIRNLKVVNIMRDDGIDIFYEQMQERFGNIVGRPHFAQILVENGLASSVKDAFNRLVGKNMRYWQPRTTISIERCIELIINAGGIPTIAHMFEYNYNRQELEELVTYCISLGVKAVEVRHPSHTKEQMELLESVIIEKKAPILMTGGSDFHGAVKPNNPLGEPFVPYSWLEALKDTAGWK